MFLLESDDHASSIILISLSLHRSVDIFCCTDFHYQLYHINGILFYYYHNMNASLSY